jgi:hypothetical protein
MNRQGNLLSVIQGPFAFEVINLLKRFSRNAHITLSMDSPLGVGHNKGESDLGIELFISMDERIFALMDLTSNGFDKGRIPERTIRKEIVYFFLPRHLSTYLFYFLLILGKKKENKKICR